jgi:hypothetical protein
MIILYYIAHIEKLKKTKMPDYQNGKIYKIIVKNTEEEYRPYIGSTSLKYLCYRWNNHKQAYKNNIKKNITNSKILFDKFGIDNCEIVLIEAYPCNSKEELCARERYWYDKIENCNRFKPMLTQEEKDNASKEYYKKLLELNPNFCKDKYVVDKARAIQKDPNWAKTLYRKRLERNPNFNKDKYLKVCHDVECECGMIIKMSSLNRHKKRDIHLKKMNAKITEDIPATI